MENKNIISNELIDLCIAYKEEQTKESIHKKAKEKIGKQIKEILGESFDDELPIESEKFNGKIRYKITIGFVANRQKIEEDGLFDDYYEPQQKHALYID